MRLERNNELKSENELSKQLKEILAKRPLVSREERTLPVSNPSKNGSLKSHCANND